MKFRRYKSEYDYSYALGMAPTVELIKTAPERVVAVFAHPEYRPRSSPDIAALCAQYGLRCETDRRIFGVLADKENTFVIGVFKKAAAGLSAAAPHVVFVNPGDAGNLGTNLRTCVGFGFLDIAVITPGADIYSPKVVRASMGALFHARIAAFPSLTEYLSAFPGHTPFFFMLSAKTDLRDLTAADTGDGRRFSLVFGNEATGLPDECARLGRGVRIAHAGAIDSLNLSVAVGIAAYAINDLARRGTGAGQ